MKPLPYLTDQERALLAALAKHGGHPPGLTAADVQRLTGLDELVVSSVVWALQDPRRLRVDLAFRDGRFSPPLYRLTPDGLDVAAGALAVEDLLNPLLLT